MVLVFIAHNAPKNKVNIVTHGAIPFPIGTKGDLKFLGVLIATSMPHFPVGILTHNGLLEI